jgi:hypothetical protein
MSILLYNFFVGNILINFGIQGLIFLSWISAYAGMISKRLLLCFGFGINIDTSENHSLSGVVTGLLFIE